MQKMADLGYTIQIFMMFYHEPLYSLIMRDIGNFLQFEVLLVSDQVERFNEAI